MLKKYINNRIFVLGLICIAISYLFYVSSASSNVPLMDYWKYINRFVEKMYTGGITLEEIWRSDGIHRSPLQFILFILNVAIFHYNVQVDIYLAAIVLMIVSCIMYKNIKNSLDSQNAILCGIYGIGVSIVIFNLNQWEMLNEQFALSFTMRLILFLLTYIFTSKYLTNIEDNKKYTIDLGVYYVFVIIMVGGGYFPAYVATIAFSLLVYFIVNYKECKFKYLRELICLIFFLLLGTYIYMHGLDTSTTVDRMVNISMDTVVIDFIKGMFVMLSVSFMGFTSSYKTYLIIGMIMFCLYFASLILYFKFKLYKKTWVPLMIYGYVFCAIASIHIGRLGFYGIDYAYSSRYVCETNLAIIAFFWIVFMLVDECKEKKIAKYIYYIPILFILANVIFSGKEEIEMGPYRKIYGQNLIDCMMQEDYEQMEDSQAALFQTERENLIQGIDILKRYELGVFYKNK